jgi:probable HAF family extracellular repeat protein
VGSSFIGPPIADHAFLYSGGVMQDLTPIPGATTSWANAINAAGRVVGASYITLYYYHAFLWSGGVMKDLGTLPGGHQSEALGINTAGQVVGGADNSSGDFHAFLYSSGVMQDLNSLVQNLPIGEVLVSAYGINDQGQIIANGIDGHAFLLTPLRSPAGPLDLLLLD